MNFTDYMFGMFRKKPSLPTSEQALPGRSESIAIDAPHAVLRTNIMPEFPEGTHQAIFAMGCFWGVEKLFWQQPGVFTTAVGYAGGYTPNPTYDEVCSGKTGHTEVVLVVYWPNKIKYEQLIQLFWSHHNPTQGFRQGNDVGSQYRSMIIALDEHQRDVAEKSKARYQEQLFEADEQEITTQIISLEGELESREFYYAEEYHQQYLAKKPDGYCNMQTCDTTGLPRPGGIQE